MLLEAPVFLADSRLRTHGADDARESSRLRDDHSFDAAFKQLEALWAAPPSYGAEQLRRLKVPVTVMVAEHDEWVRPEHTQAVMAAIPSAQLVQLPRVSHFAPWQAPKTFNDALKLLLKY